MIALQTGDILERGQAVTKGVEILSNCKRRCGAMCRKNTPRRWATYTGTAQQLMRAHREKSEAILLEVSRLLNTLMEGWTGVMDTVGSTAVSQSTGSAQRPAEYATVSGPYSLEPVGSSPDRCWQL